LIAAYQGNNLFKTAYSERTRTHDLNLPAHFFGETAIHAKEIAGKKSCFVPSCTSPNFQKSISIVVGIFWQENDFHLLVQFFLLCSKFFKLRFSEFFQLLIFLLIVND